MHLKYLISLALTPFWSYNNFPSSLMAVELFCTRNSLSLTKSSSMDHLTLPRQQPSSNLFCNNLADPLTSGMFAINLKKTLVTSSYLPLIFSPIMITYCFKMTTAFFMIQRSCSSQSLPGMLPINLPSLICF